jgi:sporulation protein YlmC with PRC-barrel domain
MKAGSLLMLFCLMAVLAGCKDFKTVAPSQSENNQAPVASDAQPAQGTADPAPVANGANENRLAAEPSQRSNPAVRRGTLMFSSSLVGSRVKDAKGNDVGKVKDILFDPEDRRVVYAIVSLSNRDIAVPISAIKMDPQSQTYTLEMTEETLAQAPNMSNDPKLAPEIQKFRGDSASSPPPANPNTATR